MNMHYISTDIAICQVEEEGLNDKIKSFRSSLLLKGSRESRGEKPLVATAVAKYSKEHAAERALLILKNAGRGAKICPADGQLSKKLGKGVSLCRTTLTNVTFFTLKWASFVSPHPFHAQAASLRSAAGEPPTRVPPRENNSLDCFRSPSCVSLTLFKRARSAACTFWRFRDCGRDQRAPPFGNPQAF